MLKAVLLFYIFTTVAGGGGHRRKGPSRCGLPTFTDRLPLEVSEQIHKIWDAYVDGEGCDKEHQETKKIIFMEASEAVRAELNRLYHDDRRLKDDMNSVKRRRH
ncbi:unnamed protein product [Nippostrongylus brasiliensis]|uniref:Uncharacterized protein n=1 Tax=Nippostrongylus brasiliensis TaxID=27835 RepID=A0A0N4YEE5_NIPBR|nr:unnamed protein product [Nippostrongylus brasiliensis]